eukprot:7129680-Pyramimonas_sp.AAC.1
MLGMTGGGLMQVDGRREEEANYHAERRDMLMRFMSTWEICAANTYGARRITHIPHCSTHVQRVLDYILIPT